MKVKEIIALNNEKQKQLNPENTQDYEDMLIYTRISSTKSEQQTEEILLELLEHILLAQDDGKNVHDIFGNDLKAYCQELIEEIPKETKKKQIKFSIKIMLIFLAVATFFKGIIDIGSYYLLSFGEITSTYYLGSSLIIIIINLGLAFLGITLILHWLKSTVFKQEKNLANVNF